MYHYDAKIALEELQEEALLPHPVKLRDMILRTQLGPQDAQLLNHDFQAYIAMVRRAPQLMGVLYEGTDRPWLHPRRRLALDRLNTAPMIRLLKRIQPDLCVATHFLPAEIIAWLIAKRKLRARHAIAVTDYDVHAMWLCRTVDRYYLAIDEAAEYLARVGVPREKLRVTGIPIDPLFAAPIDRADARKQLGLDADVTMLLISAGGYGVGPVEQLVK